MMIAEQLELSGDYITEIASSRRVSKFSDSDEHLATVNSTL
jgi:hypothetical protein